MTTNGQSLERVDGSPRSELITRLAETIKDAERWTRRNALLSARATLASALLAGHRDDLLQLDSSAPAEEALTFARLQQEQAAWSRVNFGEQPGWQPLIGAVEEIGELAHAYLKAAQNIRGSDDEHRAAAADAVGDAIIYLAGFCSACGIDLERSVRETWAAVQQRDWRRSPENGVSK